MPRPQLSLVATAAALASLPMLAQPTRLRAQVVRGVVVEEAGGAPIPGVVVTLLGADGRPVATALSGESGAYAVRAPAPGRYSLQAKRIGVRPLTSAPFDLPTGPVREERLVLGALPLVRDPIRISGTTTCAGAAAPDPALISLWEDARAALVATSITRRDERFETTVVLFERELEPRSLRVRKEQRRPERWVTARPFYSAPAADLSANGYVRALSDGTTSFFAPDADVLLSEAFLDDHCLSLERGAKGNAGLIGLRFSPVSGRTLPDVRGVLWLDDVTSELRRMEYSYTKLPDGSYNDKAGGSLHFGRLPSGGWIVEQWSIRMPVFARLQPQTGLAGYVPARDTVVAFREEGGEVTGASLPVGPGAVAGVGLPSPAPPVTPAPAAAETVATVAVVTLRGVIVDAGTDLPVPDVAVMVGTAVLARSAVDGTFTVQAARPGRSVLTLEKEGYQTGVEVAELRAGDSAGVRYALKRSAVVLADFDRRRQSGGGGRFFGRQEIARRNPARISDLLRGEPGVRVITDATGGALAVSGRGDLVGQGGDGGYQTRPCELGVAVDGRPPSRNNRLNDVAPADVAALELYVGTNAIPRDFAQVSAGAWCGLIVIWTRRGD